VKEISRRTFLEQVALVSGAAVCSSLPRSRAADSIATPELFGGDLTLEGFDERLTARTSAARARFQRVAAFINRDQPRLRAATLAAADEAMRGLLLLPGNRALSEVGNPPDWLSPRYGDEEYLWSLNRMMHWKTLLHAHALTRDERYAEKVVAELDDWMMRATRPSLLHADGSPNPEVLTNAGPPPWRALEIGMRMFDSWPVVVEQLAGTKHLPSERLQRLAGCVAQQAEAISLLSPLLWPAADHNHYFMEMLGLLAVGVYFPEIAKAPAWTDQALRELERCVQKQFTSDGGHIEACPSYHNICVVLLARYLALARIGKRTLPEMIVALAAASGDQTLHSTRPTGEIVPWGDSTRSNQVEAALWLYNAGGGLRVLQHLMQMMGAERVREDCAPHLWDIEDPAMLFARMTLSPTTASLVRWDRGNDQVMARTAWTPEALNVFFSCHSPLVEGSGHQHIDLGGFDFTAYGRTLVADPGVFTYRECEDRRIFKSAEYHSVLTVDERGPFDYVSRWRYTPQKEGRVTVVESKAGLVRWESFHRNYAPAECRRTMALVDDRLLVVIDHVTGLRPGSTVQIYFHLDSLTANWDAVDRCVQTNDEDVRVAMTVSDGLLAELLPGRISEKFDVARPSTRVKLFDEGGTVDRVYAAVVVPFRAGETATKVSDLRVIEVDRRCEFYVAGRLFSVRYS
jgi:hypothetical protein